MIVLLYFTINIEKYIYIYIYFNFIQFIVIYQNVFEFSNIVNSTTLSVRVLEETKQMEDLQPNLCRLIVEGRELEFNPLLYKGVGNHQR